MPELAPPAISAETLAALEQPILAIETLAVLRPWNESDASSIVEAFQDEAIQRWHVRRADSAEEARSWIARWNNSWMARSECTWAIADPQSDAPIGRISLKDINARDGVADIAYWMTPAARGRGICPRAVDTISRWAFDEAGIVRLQLEHSMLNDASCRVATKAGFTPEGIRRRAARHADGWHDMHLHARLSAHHEVID